MVTAFGRFLRKIRIDNNEVMKDMAKRLGVSTSYLSTVESGKKSAPAGWCDTIAEQYGLSAEQHAELKSAAKESVPSIRLDLSKAGQLQRAAVFAIADRLDSMSDETALRVALFLS